MKLDELISFSRSTSESYDGKHWVPCRPMTAENTFLMPRIKAAWRVLLGHSDAVEWVQPQQSDDQCYCDKQGIGKPGVTYGD